MNLCQRPLWASGGGKAVFEVLRLQHPLRPLLELFATGLRQALGHPTRQRAEAPRQSWAACLMRCWRCTAPRRAW
jgi:hypothetical protein